ncbi:MAG: TVP38/TMEM64 family protein [Phycisphaerales bacterium]|nr:TVP38/TMEM64 family protein [Phycisphaerales bacterium]
MNEPSVQPRVQPPTEPLESASVSSERAVAELEAGPGLKEIFLRLGPAGYLALAWAFFPALGGFLLLLRIGAVGDWLQAQHELGLAIYVTIFIFSAGFGLLPTYAQAFLGGWTFGFRGGLAAALAGFVGGSIIGYVLARTASRDRAERLIAENPKARAVRDALIGHGFWKTLGIVTLLRVPPNSPFAITNLVMASTGVSKLAFVIGTALGMAPRTAIAVYLATQVHGLSQDLTKETVTTPWPWKVAGIVATLVVLGILYHIGDRAVKKVTRANGTTHMAPR